VKGEAPQSGTYTLSNAQSALSHGGESKRRAPPIGESYTLEKLSQLLTTREESPPNWGVMHSQTAKSALSYGGESKGRAPPIGESYTLEKLSQPLTTRA